MELSKEGDKFKNGLGEIVTLEHSFVFPMLKSSDVASDSPTKPKRWMLVTQQNMQDETSVIKQTAPKTWDYLKSHANLLNQRGSIIYKNRAEFSIFGVGDYSFADWKVAISGFYKKLAFKVVSPFEGKPVVLDDTSYFLPCRSKKQAEFLVSILSSKPAQNFFEGYIFWDAKRPITVDLLSRIDIEKLVQVLGLNPEFNRLFKHSAPFSPKKTKNSSDQLSFSSIV